MTARPGRIKLIQQSPFDRDRDAMELRTRPEFGRREAEIWRLMADEVGFSLDGAQGDD
jgi:hypothetical protein